MFLYQLHVVCCLWQQTLHLFDFCKQYTYISRVLNRDTYVLFILSPITAKVSQRSNLGVLNCGAKRKLCRDLGRHSFCTSSSPFLFRTGYSNNTDCAREQIYSPFLQQSSCYKRQERIARQTRTCFKTHIRLDFHNSSRITCVYIKPQTNLPDTLPYLEPIMFCNQSLT